MPGAADRQRATAAREHRDFSGFQQSATASLRKTTRPLQIAGVPPMATSWVDGWNAGFAGLLLLASLFFRGNLMAGFLLIAGAVAGLSR